jgi:hypothetical protein
MHVVEYKSQSYQPTMRQVIPKEEEKEQVKKKW